MLKSNVIKGWITSAVGTCLMAATLFLWFTGVINLKWEGTIGLVLGCILLLSPKTIEKKISEYIKTLGSSTSEQAKPTEEKIKEE